MLEVVVLADYLNGVLHKVFITMVAGLGHVMCQIWTKQSVLQSTFSLPQVYIALLLIITSKTLEFLEAHSVKN